MRLGLALLAIGFSLGAQAATVSLVIDDLGYNRERARRALALPPPIVAAVLPDSPYAGRIAAAARRADIELLLHMPMQGHGDGRHAGMLSADLGEEDFRQRLQHGLAQVPGAIGVNNHMGSVLTRNPAAMNLVMDELKLSPEPLLYLDSRTTPESVAQTSAERAGIATARRDVFLDHDRDPAAIERQFELWLRKARTTGCALAIAHPHPETLAVLERLLRHVEGVRRVGIADYVRECGSPVEPDRAQIATRVEDAPAHRRR